MLHQGTAQSGTVSTGSSLRIEDVRHDYHVSAGLGRKARLQALRGITLDVAEGEIVGLVGESGCGKSTLARLLLGIETPTSGRILVGGRSIGDYGRLERARLIQPVFQDPFSSLNPRMRIGRTIAAPLEVQGRTGQKERHERTREMMRFVGLSEDLHHAYPSQLSGGQGQRVAIARALIGEPRILIFDEPTSALDVSVQSQILNLIARLHREFGLTMVFISHNLSVVSHLADRVAVMYLGRLVEIGPTHEVFRTPRHPYTRALLDAVLVPKSHKGLPDIRLGAEFPSPLAPPPGCAFHPRCPAATALCSRDEPDPQNERQRLFRCHNPLSV